MFGVGMPESPPRCVPDLAPKVFNPNWGSVRSVGWGSTSQNPRAAEASYSGLPAMTLALIRAGASPFTLDKALVQCGCFALTRRHGPMYSPPSPLALFAQHSSGAVFWQDGRLPISRAVQGQHIGVLKEIPRPPFCFLDSSHGPIFDV